ncbi:NDP-sugar synthase [Prevotella disiens]|uniref:NDP-sugar synthase n=1 Tax=Prevotella disiens TaxID=28130 RepID=UPI00336A4654
MKYAIIAAGNGSRLHQEGVKAPKPLVKVNGERLIDRLLRIFCNNQATEIIVICNKQMTDVQEHLADVQQHGLNGKEVPLRFIVKTTPSSMHSFYEISSLIGKEPFVLTTVDTIFREDEFSVYIHEFQKEIEDGTQAFMGVTDYIDDEKPLYVSTDEAMNIIGFHDKNTGNCQYISGGIYGLTPETITTLNNCMERGESRMRNFQRALIADGRKTKAYAFTKVLDIDHATDIEKAEEYLKP